MLTLDIVLYSGGFWFLGLFLYLGYKFLDKKNIKKKTIKRIEEFKASGT